MEWTRILAYITGNVDQELLLRNEDPAAGGIHSDPPHPPRSNRLLHGRSAAGGVSTREPGRRGIARRLHPGRGKFANIDRIVARQRREKSQLSAGCRHALKIEVTASHAALDNGAEPHHAPPRHAGRPDPRGL